MVETGHLSVRRSAGRLIAEPGSGRWFAGLSFLLTLMKSRRIPLRTTLGVAVLACVVLFAAMGCASSTLDPVAAAAETTMNVPSARFRLVQTVSVPDRNQTVRITGTGAYAPRLKTGQMHFTFETSGSSDGGPRTGSGDIIFDDTIFYLRMSAFAGKLPPGKRWVKVDLEKAAEAQGLGPLPQAGSENPNETLRYLRAAGDVKKIGAEEVDGVATTHYHALVHLDRVPDTAPEEDRGRVRAAIERLTAMTGTKTIPIDVWIDEKRRVRREQFSLTMHLRTPTGERETVKMNARIDLFDFGARVAIRPPAADEVISAEDVTPQPST